MSPVKDLLEGLERVREKQRKGSKPHKVIALARPQDYEMIEKNVLEDLIHGHVTYFSLTVADPYGYSSCFFTPISQDKEHQKMMFVGDYEKILRVLLSHPKIRHVEYVPEWRVIQAIFDDPFPQRSEEDVVLRETLKLEDRDREEASQV